MSCGFYYVRKIANFPFVEVKHVTFWRSFYGICIILALFHSKETSFVYQGKRGFFVVELPAER